MFDRVLGLPAHPLMVHAAVVLVPLLALAALAYAVVPMTRRHIRWPVILLALAAPVAVLTAKLSGDAFSKNDLLSAPEMQNKIEQHAEFGDVLVWLVAGLGLASLLLAALVTQRRPHVERERRVAHAVPADDGGSVAMRRDTATREGGLAVVERDRGDTLVAPARGLPPVLQWLLVAAVVALAVASLYYVFKSGDSGAKMVWNGF